MWPLESILALSNGPKKKFYLLGWMARNTQHDVEALKKMSCVQLVALLNK